MRFAVMTMRCQQGCRQAHPGLETGSCRQWGRPWLPRLRGEALSPWALGSHGCQPSSAPWLVAVAAWVASLPPPMCLPTPSSRTVLLASVFLLLEEPQLCWKHLISP